MANVLAMTQEFERTATVDLNPKEEKWETNQGDESKNKKWQEEIIVACWPVNFDRVAAAGISVFDLQIRGKHVRQVHKVLSGLPCPFFPSPLIVS